MLVEDLLGGQQAPQALCTLPNGHPYLRLKKVSKNYALIICLADINEQCTYVQNCDSFLRTATAARAGGERAGASSGEEERTRAGDGEKEMEARQE